ncbi:MAG: phosphomannose isomerase type II C-terminal cupin domain [Syntrophales bacterium]|nr:phosphomannose isomerase type II C-terminal cupin domain [Syntrophales bacterium]
MRLTALFPIIWRPPRRHRRPWGFYQILSDMPDHRIKRITVSPGQRLRYQRHFYRSEHWYVVKGHETVTKNGEAIELASGQALNLPVGSWHRIRNHGEKKLVFIEVQTGDYFGEDDIERSEDDYGRV